MALSSAKFVFVTLHRLIFVLAFAWLVASSPGHSQILSHSRGKKKRLGVAWGRGYMVGALGLYEGSNYMVENVSFPALSSFLLLVVLEAMES